MKDTVTYLSPYDFTLWACEKVRDGHGFVPLVGSGISAKSGILMGVEFMEYLSWTVYRCVAEPGKDQDDERLDLRQAGWPSHPRPAEVRKVKKWIWRIFEKACNDCGLEPLRAQDDELCLRTIVPLNRTDYTSGIPLDAALRRPLVPELLKSRGITDVDDRPIQMFFRALQHDNLLKTFRGDPGTSPTSQRYIEECAIRSLHDWRSTLEFLSQLKRYRGNSPKDDHLCIDPEIDQAVIDSFNLHITRGRRPNFAHGMLCHLAHRARFRTILTTNFDNLVEDAFAQLGESYAVFPVSVNGNLPPPDSVHAQNCIVKLHGGGAETRASHSVDDPPSEEDKRRFFHYVRGRYPDDPEGRSGFLPSHLLVCGYSGKDMRCVLMIKYLLDWDPNAQVFWICHSRGDAQHLQELFGKEGYGIATRLGLLHEQLASGQIKERLIVTVSPRTDLLLYELYQRLALALPRGGFNFPLSHHAPPEESFTPGVNEEPISEFAKNLVEEVCKNRNRRTKKLIVADGGSGLTPPLRQAFNQLTRSSGFKGIWLELDYYANEWALAHAIYEQIAVQLGRFQLDHARFVPDGLLKEQARQDEIIEKETNKERKIERIRESLDDQVKYWKAHTTLLLRYWNIDPSNWLIVLNARNGPGGFTGWGQTYWSEKTYGRVAALIKALLVVERAPLSVKNDSSDGERRGNGDLTTEWREKGATSERAEQRGFNVLYAPYSEKRFQRDREKEEWVTTRVACPCQHASDVIQEAHLQRYRITGQITPDIIAEVLRDDSKYNPKVCTISEEPLRSFEQRVEDVITLWFDPGCELHKDPQQLRILRRRRFLYAATFFRFARHLSSFSSEGVYPAAHEFSIRHFGQNPPNDSAINVGLDNDWLRSGDVRSWLEQLNVQNRIFLCTPGAHAWMHRDARLAIQYIAENTKPWDLEHVDASLDVYSSYGSALEMRARTHFWIGIWYRRAFCTTGHAVALLEALHHFAECVVYAPLAKRGKLTTDDPCDSSRKGSLIHRQRLAKHAVFEMIKSLRLGRGAIEFWMQPSAGDAWFGEEAVRHLEDAMRSAFRALKKQAEEENSSSPALPWESWIALLVSELERSPSLAPERRASKRKAEDHTRTSCRAGTNMSGENSSHEENASHSDEHRGSRLLSAREIEMHDWEEGLADFLIETIECCSGAKLPDSGRRVIEKLASDLDEFRRKPSELRTAIQEWRDLLIQERAFLGKGLCVARAVNEAAFLHIQRARSFELVYGFEHTDTDPAAFPWFSRKSSECWSRVSALCKLTLELCFDLHPRFTTPDFHLRIQSLTLAGLARGHLGRFFEAHHYFDDAHAMLARLEGHVQQPDVATIHLRSAEVHLSEAHVLRRFASLLTSQFLTSRHIEAGKLERCFRKHEVDGDAVQFLERCPWLLGPQLSTDGSAARYADVKTLEQFVKTRGGDSPANEIAGAVAFHAVRDYFENKETSGHTKLQNLLNELRRQTGETTLVQTVTMLMDESSAEGSTPEREKKKDGRREFFMVLSATLLAPTIDGSQTQVASPAEIEAAVLAAAQYYHLYLGHLRPEKDNTADFTWVSPHNRNVKTKPWHSLE